MPVFLRGFVLKDPVADNVIELSGKLMGLRVALEAALYGIVGGGLTTSQQARQVPSYIIEYMSQHMKGLRDLSEMIGYPRDTPRCFRVKREVLRDLYGLLSFIAHPGGPSDDEFRSLVFSSGVYFLNEIFQDFARNLMIEYAPESMPMIIHDMANLEIEPSKAAAPPGAHLVPLVKSYENDGMEIDLPVPVMEGTSEEKIRYLAGVSC